MKYVFLSWYIGLCTNGTLQTGCRFQRKIICEIIAEKLQTGVEMYVLRLSFQEETSWWNIFWSNFILYWWYKYTDVKRPFHVFDQSSVVPMKITSTYFYIKPYSFSSPVLVRIIRDWAHLGTCYSIWMNKSTTRYFCIWYSEWESTLNISVWLSIPYRDHFVPSLTNVWTSAFAFDIE